MGLLGYSLVVLLLAWAVSTACGLAYMHRSRRVFSFNAISLMSAASMVFAVLCAMVVVIYGPSGFYDAKPWLPESSWLAQYLARQGG